MIWSRDTGQRIPCFDRCQLTIIWRSNIKDVRCKLGTKRGLYVCSLVLVVVWLPCFAMSLPCMQLAGPKFKLTNQDSAGGKNLRRNPPDVGVTSGQKPSTKIIYIVLQTSVGLF